MIKIYMNQTNVNRDWVDIQKFNQTFTLFMGT